ncbi:MAG: beta-propeller fold lactonase family protein [Pseudolysinimonas sp.]
MNRILRFASATMLGIVVGGAACAPAAFGAPTPAPGTVLATIPIGSKPQDAVVSPDNRFAFVTTLDDGMLTKIDLDDFTVVASVHVGQTAGAVVWRSKSLVVADAAGGVLATVDPDTMSILDTFDTGGSDPIALTVSADGEKTVFAASAGHAIGIIDDAEQSFSFVDVDGAPWGVDLFADDTMAIVADQTNARVVITTLGTGAEAPAVVSDVAVGGRPSYIAVSPDQSVAYVANADRGSVDVVDLQRFDVMASYSVGGKPWGVAVSWDGEYLYVPDNSGGGVVALDASGGAVLSTTATGIHPDFVALSPDGTRVLVPNSGSNTLTVVQGYSSPPGSAGAGTDGTGTDGSGTEGTSGSGSAGGMDPTVLVVAIGVGVAVLFAGIFVVIVFLSRRGSLPPDRIRVTNSVALTKQPAPPGWIDPDATAAQLAEYATRPEYRAAVAAHRNAYPDLLTWLAALGDPAVDAALRARS